MDKFKEKLASLRIEADTANARADEIANKLKDSESRVAAMEQEEISLKNRIQLLEAQLEKTESGHSESTTKSRDLELQIEEFNRKVKSLEAQNETLEKRCEDLEAKYHAAKAELDDLEKVLGEA
ncbi:hypothetical protein BGZ73_007516 [Actinomortierella ambigua]|nr:hypothetical protein BGZ73_007516 [Actinomortierella ambigua]